MPWARLDDQMNDDAKLRALSDGAFRLWVSGLIFCQKNLTDGFIPAHEVDCFAVRQKNRAPLVAELCASLVPGKGPLWHKVETGYQMHDYLDWNDTRDKVLTDRKKAEDRQSRFKDRRRFKRVASAVHNAVHNALLAALRDEGENGVAHGVGNGATTYHVPPEVPVPPVVPGPKEQERAPNGAKSSLSDVEIRMLRRTRSRETDTGRPAVRVITALARHVLRAHPDYDEGDLMEAVKRACVRANLAYDGAVGPAIDRARAQLGKRRGKRQEATA